MATYFFSPPPTSLQKANDSWSRTHLIESIHQYYKTKLESQATRPTSFPQTENENKDSLGSANVYNLLNFTAETAGKQSRKKLHQFDYSKLSGCQYFAKT